MILAQIQFGMLMVAQIDNKEWNDYLCWAHFDLVNQTVLIPRLAVMWGSAWKQHLLVQSASLTINESESSVLFHDFHVSESTKVHFFRPEKLWRAWWNIFGMSIAFISKISCSNHKKVQVKAWFGDL